MPTAIKRWIRHNLFLKVLALIIGTVVWFVASRWVYETRTLTVPVELILASGMTLKNVIPPAITVTLEYPREAVAWEEEKESEIKVVHDLSKTRTPGRIVFDLQDNDVKTPSRCRVITLSPSRITAEIDHLSEKVLPVKVVFKGTPGRGYRIAGQRVIPPEIRVPGPESLLGTMTKIETEPVNVMGREISFDAAAALKPISSFSGEEKQKVTVIVTIRQELKERVFKAVGVDILKEAGRGGNIQLAPKQVDLYLKGPEPAIDAVTVDDLRVYVDIIGLEPGPWELFLQTAFPPDVVLDRADPAIVKVTLEQGPGGLLGPGTVIKP
ncbi:MAG: CdaR family protein [PVC group bacterium]